MGARYYGNSLARFMSTDPKGLAIRHLLNPQKLNKYSYVINNPMSLFDPNGMEEITITFRSFIPKQEVGVFGWKVLGDNRSFSTAPNASARTAITIRLETDAQKRPGNPIITQSNKAGLSTTIDPDSGRVTTGTCSKSLPTATGSRDANGNPVINIQVDQQYRN
jgi:hypothetical protein